MCLISGLPGVCATLTVVTDLTSSPRTSTAGSGQPTRPGWRPQTAGPPSTTGQPPEGEKILRQKKYVRKYLSLWKYYRFSPSPKPQPDNREQTQLGGESESCMAVLNNFYGDGKALMIKRGDISDGLCFRNQVARCGLSPREAHHLRGCRGSSCLRQADLPQHQDPLNGENTKQY